MVTETLRIWLLSFLNRWSFGNELCRAGQYVVDQTAAHMGHGEVDPGGEWTSPNRVSCFHSAYLFPLDYASTLILQPLQNNIIWVEGDHLFKKLKSQILSVSVTIRKLVPQHLLG